LQNGRVRAAKQVQRAVGRAPAGIVIVTRYGEEPDPAASQKIRSP
jgi:hypothetical protein